MTPRNFFFLLTLLISVIFTHALAYAELRADEKTAVYLNKFRSDYSQSIRDGKPKNIVAYYSDECRLMPEFQKTVMGKSNAALYHKAFLNRFTVKEYNRVEKEILDLGSRVVEHGAFTMKLKAKMTGKEHELAGKYQNIWAKSKTGELSLLTEAWNYNHQTEIDQQLVFAEVPTVYTALGTHVPINSNISFELAALNRLSEVTITQHDAAVWSQFYADDAMLLYSRHPAYTGRKEIDEFLAKHVKEIPVFEKLDIRTDRIDDLGEYVIEYASHIASFRQGQFAGVNTGKNIVIWRREKNGPLKVFRGIAMYD